MVQNKIIEKIEIIRENFLALEKKSDSIEKIAEIWINCIKNGGKVIFCGNGGSAADSQHLAAELMGRYKLDREPLSAMSLTIDTSAITSIGNDYGYEYVFSRTLKGIGKKGDVLVGISTSGNSQNIIEAFKIAKEMQITTVAFTGSNGGELIKIADTTLNVPSNITNNIQEMHMASGHIICELVEKYFFEKRN